MTDPSWATINLTNGASSGSARRVSQDFVSVNPPFIYFCAQDQLSTCARGTPKSNVSSSQLRGARSRRRFTRQVRARTASIQTFAPDPRVPPNRRHCSCCGFCVVGYDCQVSGNEFDPPNFRPGPTVARCCQFPASTRSGLYTYATRRRIAEHYNPAQTILLISTASTA
jgi:hypothetical protein